MNLQRYHTIHSLYLHELDIEPNTNRNLSIKYNHNTGLDIIWESIEAASYCYGLYQKQDAICRIDTNNSIACILNLVQRQHTMKSIDCYSFSIELRIYELQCFRQNICFM